MYQQMGLCGDQGFLYNDENHQQSTRTATGWEKVFPRCTSERGQSGELQITAAIKYKEARLPANKQANGLSQQFP